MRFGQLAVLALSVSPLRAVADYLPGSSDSLVVRAHYARAAPAASPSDRSASATSDASPSSKTASPKSSKSSKSARSANSSPDSSSSDSSSSDSSSTDSSNDSSTDSASETSSPTGSDSDQANLNTATAPPSKTSSSKKGSQTGKAGGKGNSTSTDSGDDASPTHTTFNALDPAAGVQINTPLTNVPIGTALYKIGDILTFGWNYTNLQGTPDAIDVLVTCSTSSSLWTLASNMTFQTSVEFIWDTLEQAQSINQPLLTAVYTLIIKDSSVPINARPEPGYLGAFSLFTFGLYQKQSYVPWDSFQCLDCPKGAGSGGFDLSAVRLALTMGVVSVLSFTWFVGGLGL